VKTPTLDPMLASFLGLLDVRLRRITPTITPGADIVKDDALQEITKGLEQLQTDHSMHEDETWNRAYRLERLFALVEPSDLLWLELKRRLARAAEENVKSYNRLSLATEALAPVVLDPKGGLAPGGDAAVRSLLLETLEDTHSTIQRKFYSRPIRKKATTRIVCFGMLAFFLFILPYFVLYYNLFNGEKIDIKSWAWLPIYTVATSGLFGALFSRLLYLQQNWDALTIGGLKDAKEFASIILRACVGMIGAVLVFFFLKSGIIGGGLFPDFSRIGVEEFKIKPPTDSPSTISFRLYYPTQSWALLVVWSFLAGFSERLVPSILRETEARFGQPSTQK
jgi:hypothetical protein